MTEYTTSQGDTWDLISFKCYGREKFINELINANYEHRETVVFGSGVVLAIPEMPQGAITFTAPPWERGA